VEIEPAAANAVELKDAIKEAGYTPVAIGNSPMTPVVASATTRKGCCCG